ncbi:MAG: glycosyltransferase [Calditrichaeota bacterium]|nr:MAG: glycosyltransferase [Calditrichota bacterium]
MNKKLNIAVIGTYLPRRCGIGAFTTDLSESMAKELGKEGQVFAIAMNDIPEGYPYSERVRMEIQTQLIKDYTTVADFLNINSVDILIVQHEYGIYGGPAGAHILRLIKNLRMPVITTLHTVLLEPDPMQRKVMEELIEYSERLVVLSHKAEEILQSTYKAPVEKIIYIPHGIPDVPFVDPNYYKDQFGVEGRKVILTFGLLSPSKGIEYMIHALPEIIRNHPDVVYTILGATHPHVKRAFGEEYRQMLQRKVLELKIRNHVIFLDRFVSLTELMEYIGAADLYVTPYLNREQVVSGTLSYAMGAGKAVVSTPYWYAEEMLADERGKLVPFKDSRALSEAINYLLDHDTERNAIRKRAYQFCRHMIWPEVARSYIKTVDEIIKKRATHPKIVFNFTTQRDEEIKWPEIDLRHLKTLTDDTGILQHAIYSVPDRRHGYCTDDNARGLIVTSLYYQLLQDETILPFMYTFMEFLIGAFNEKTGRFRNFLSYERRWLEDVGSEDAHGRALWALGTAIACTAEYQKTIMNLCTRLFNEALPAVEDLKSPRSWAFSLIGIHAYLRRFAGDTTVKRYRELLARRIQDMFDASAEDNWPWCEDIVTYANGVIPHALILSGQWIPDFKMLDTGLQALKWLLEIQTGEEGQLTIIGNDGWLTKDGHRARFDQQPIEAMLLIQACIEAFHATQENFWLEEARRCFYWFLGRNDLNVPLYDFTTGGCKDGLQPNGPNENQGAESTLAWLISLLSMYSIRDEQIRLTSMDKKQRVSVA